MAGHSIRVNTWKGLVALAVGLGGCGGPNDPARVSSEPLPVVSQGEIEIFEPWIPEPAANVAALYLRIRSANDQGDRLLDAFTDVARHVALHQTRIEGGRASMRAAEAGFPIPPAGSLVLEPGGAHVMLMGLTRPLREGDTVEVGLVLERAGAVPLLVPVVARRRVSEPAHVHQAP